MINRVIGSMIFVSCLFALLLSLNGVEAPFWFGNEFRSFIVATNYDLQNSFLGKIKIPNIPTIQNIGFLPFSDNVGANIIAVVSNFFNGFAQFINGLITILNVLILIINTAIQLLSFILVFLRNIIIMKDSIIAYA